MSGSFIYGATGSNDANEELRVRAEMREAEAQLAETRDALVKATQAYEDLRRRLAASPE
jgi:molecular chaperone GrpE (heat shock protein)